MAKKDKIVWLKTTNKEVLTTGLELGLSTFLFDEKATQQLKNSWSTLGRFSAISQLNDGRLVDENNTTLGHVHRLSSAADLAAIESQGADGGGIIIMAPTDKTVWTIIPLENLIASFQSNPEATLLAFTPTAEQAVVMLTSLEIGTDGVVLCTEDPTEVRTLASQLQGLQNDSAQNFNLQTARVTAVKAVGMGDRACVDLASNMVPGEGMLVGSFARGLFLVHSECEESNYIKSRPFRVNAGPVHAYVSAPNNKTAYLSELKSGDEALIVDAEGRQRRAVVGRVKIEARPLVLVEAVTSDGGSYSSLLQNAETVKLVGPSSSSSDSTLGIRGDNKKWRAISVSELKQGDEVYVLPQGAARHTGIAIEEKIVER